MPLILATLFAVLVAIAVPTLVGAVIGRLLSWRRPITADDWIDAPFLGVAGIILPLQFAYTSGLPLRYTAMPLLALYAVAAIILIARKWLGSRRDLPVAPFGVALAVYAVQGIGLFVVGVERYLGRAWGDQINYVLMSEFLWRYPEPAAGTVGLPLFAVIASPYIGLRIGQSILLATLARVAGIDAKAAFEPTILLGSFLIVLGIFSVVRSAGLPSRWSLLAGGIAGVVPAVSALQLECFLSHALGLPLVIYVIALCARTARTGRGADFVKLALVLSSLAAIYLEFLPFAMACVVVLFAAGFWTAPPRWRWFAQTALVLASPFVLRAAHGISGTFSSIGQPVLGNIYPWALSSEGIERLWLGDLAYVVAVRQAIVVRLLTLGVTAAGYAGLLLFLILSLRRSDSEDRAAGSRVSRVVLALTLCGVSAAPLLIIARDRLHPYQFYKLMVSATPLLVAGLALLAWTAMRWMQGRRLIQATVVASAVAIGVLAVAVTVAMGLDSARWPPLAPSQARQTTQLTLTPGFAEVQPWLVQQPGRSIVSCLSDSSWSGGYVNAWLTYFGRDSQVWALNPRVNDQNLRTQPGGRGLDRFPVTGIPKSLIVTSGWGVLWNAGSSTSTVWQAGDLRASEPSSKPFALACHVTIRADVLHPDRADLIIPPDEADVAIMSSASGGAVLSARSTDPATRQLMPGVVLVVDGQPIAAVSEADGWRYDLPLRAGLSLIHFARQRAGAPVEELDSVLHLTSVRLVLADRAASGSR